MAPPSRIGSGRGRLKRNGPEREGFRPPPLAVNKGGFAMTIKWTYDDVDNIPDDRAVELAKVEAHRQVAELLERIAEILETNLGQMS